MGPQTSDIWVKFTRIDEKHAKCKYCFKILKSSGNTTNLRKHYKTHENQKTTFLSP